MLSVVFRLATGLGSAMIVAALGCQAAAAADRSYDTNAVLVTFRDRPSAAVLERRARDHGALVKRRFTAIESRTGRGIVALRAGQGRRVEDLVEALRQSPFVASASLNYYRHAVGGVPDDPFFRDQWALVNTGQTANGFAGTSGADIGWLAAKALMPATGDVVVAVIDSGVDYLHPDLAASMWTNPGEVPDNGIDDDTNGFVDDVHGYDFGGNVEGAGPDSDPMDDTTTHGTFCAGLIASVRNNAMGLVGAAAPQARIMALKVSEGSNTFPLEDIIAATDYAILMKNRGVNIVVLNESFGGTNYVSQEADAVAAAGAAGIIVSAAAGNSSANTDTASFFPVNFAHANVIGVAATDAQDQLASFSNFGTNHVDLAAPGRNVFSLVPTHQALSASLFTTSSTYSASPMTLSGLTTGITATVVHCGLGYPTSFPAAVQGQIALIQRGELFFYEKVQNAMASGAVAAVIYNNVSGGFGGTLIHPTNWIPAVSISMEDGEALLAQLPAVMTAIVTGDVANAYGFGDGTSYAAPYVSAAVAIMAAAFPSDTVSQRIARVLSQVDVLPSLSGKTRTSGRLDLASALDTDDDQLGDWWELQYTNALGGIDGAGDPDGDGVANALEFAAGSDPLDGASYFEVAGSGPVPGGRMVIQWPSVAGKQYRIHTAADATSAWSSASGLIPATPPVNARTVQVNDATAVFRIEVE
jgi:subtilisin family serine protease